MAATEPAALGGKAGGVALAGLVVATYAVIVLLFGDGDGVMEFCRVFATTGTGVDSCCGVKAECVKVGG